jgi:hypothetical protein
MQKDLVITWNQKLYDGWSTWLAHVGFYDWNFSHNKQWTKDVFNHIEPIFLPKIWQSLFD